MLAPEMIPSALKAYTQWVLWRYIDRGAGRKPDKQPVNPHTLGNAGVHWPNTWSTFPQVYRCYTDAQHGHPRYQKAGITGIGFVLTPSDEFTAIDLDACVQADGTLLPHTLDVITEVASYTEISPSGHGLRILVSCPAFTYNRKIPAVELYSHDRYVTLTGNHIEGTPLTIASVDATVLHTLIPEPIAQLAAPLSPTTPNIPPQNRRASDEGRSTRHIYEKPLPTSPIYQRNGEPKWRQLPDSDLWEYIFAHDKFGQTHQARFHGDTAQEPGGDHSFTVIRLLNCLAAWTGCDPVRMRNMILMSHLKNEKWFEPRGNYFDWLDYQIHDAIRYRTGKGQP